MAPKRQGVRNLRRRTPTCLRIIVSMRSLVPAASRGLETTEESLAGTSDDLGEELVLSQTLTVVLSEDGRLGFWIMHRSGGDLGNSFVTLSPAQGSFLSRFVVPTRPVDIPATASERDELVELVAGLKEMRLLVPTHEKIVRSGNGDSEEVGSYYMRQPNAVDATKRQFFLDAADRAGLDMRNTLSYLFDDTEGFKFEFTRDGADQVLKYVPEFKEYLDLVMSQHEHFMRFFHGDGPDSRLAQFGIPNVFKMNLLKFKGGGFVSKHEDDDPDAGFAEWVTVLYLAVPETEGGDLWLEHNGRPITILKPKAGDLLRFRGDLTHGVLPTAEQAGERITLVLESYLLEERDLAKRPVFSCLSRLKP